MNMKINALLLGALSVLTAACSSDSSGEPADDALLKSFVLTIGASLLKILDSTSSIIASICAADTGLL